MSSRFCVIRSGPLGNRPIADVMKGLVKRFGRGRIIFHKHSNIESFTLLREGLEPLDTFSTVSSVIVSRSVEHERADREPYVRAIRSHKPGISRMNLTIDGTEVEGGGPFEFALTYGWQMEQGGENFPNFSIQVAGTSRGVKDLGYRRDLFMKVIDLIGLTGILQVNWDAGNLRISSIPSYEAVPILAQIGGANPMGIGIPRLPSINAAVDAGELIIERIIQRIDNSEFYGYAEGKDGYELRLRPLCAIASGWKIEIEGSLTGASGLILAGKPTQNASARIPAFIWEEKDGKERHSPWFVYSGELVATDEGYCLELTTDRNDRDRLMDYASSIDGLCFRQMDQAGP